MSTWIFDLGNTRLKAAALQADGTLGEVQAFAHAGDAEAFAGTGTLPGGETACIASVAGAGLTAAVLCALAGRFGRISRLRTRAQFGELRIAYPRPEQFGVDRFAALVAARARTREAVLLVGVGTALTLDLLDATVRHHGGRIAPSPSLMRQSLHARVPALPPEGGASVDFADNTADALASGCEHAATALVLQARDAAARLIGTAPRVVLHGGGAQDLLAALPDARYWPCLVLEGVARHALATGLAAP